MDTRTGELYSEEVVEYMKKQLSELHEEKLENKLNHLKWINTDLLTPKAIKNKKVGRNDICPCGSGKKFKHCCLEKRKAKLD